MFHGDFVHKFLLIINCIIVLDAARILGVFPIPSISHQVVFRPITQELARRGHDLVIITTDPAFSKEQAPNNIREIDIHNKSYEMWEEAFVKKVNGYVDNLQLMESMYKTFSEIFDMQINTEEIQDLLKSEQHFDLVLCESLIRTDLVMAHLYKAPVIQITTLAPVSPLLYYMGVPIHPLLYPEAYRQGFLNLTLWEKFQGLYQDGYTRYYQWRYERIENEMLKKNFGPDTPTVSELLSNVDMSFFNVDPLWDSNRPLPPSAIRIGGLPDKPRKPLPDDLKKYLDASKHGVIYMSFGTNVDPALLPAESIQIFNRVFSKLPYDVLWKWSKDEMSGRSPNVRITKWVPQSDLLRHPQIKLFITQGGLQSTHESLDAGVPLIAFPMLGDQWYNAERYVQYKVGLRLEFSEISEELVETSIKKVIDDENYRRNAIKLGKLMKDTPQTSLEKAVWWAEYVIRHGGAKHLRPPSADISWWDYLMLDVVFTLLAILVGVLAILKMMVNYLISLIAPSKKMKMN